MFPTLFSGLACFSPSVAKDVGYAWEDHGGTVARTSDEKNSSTFFFCSGFHDPWLHTLVSRGVVVFCAQWVVDCSAAHTRIRIADYVLDDFARTALLDAKHPIVERSSSPTIVDGQRSSSLSRDDAFVPYGVAVMRNLNTTFT
ncbi:hypothetical protein EXIGLDRAFT_404846 [Exidia glandulosa HHB12029]|uniref:BRCT domain-containing protein n=1 Tax=Exidia glandulosa HHB12029 TaxID=1314781 RepID=A0A165KSH5_EXIGL|nr:hypothetical protein EXIGLDRAFT_404846 [Exidia glandulosa HHB12029]